MSQERKLVFGALVETEDLPVTIGALFSPGRLVGMDFSAAASDLLAISAGSCLLPDGILILEDQTQQLLVRNSSFAADYTVVYQLQDTRVLGGSPASLRLLPGILRQNDFLDSVVLGWIKYPGGSVPLAPEHFIQPTPVRVHLPEGGISASFRPPFTEAILAGQEISGSTAVKTFRQANLSTDSSFTTNFVGQTARILGATVATDTVTIPSDIANYDTFSVRRAFQVTATTSTGSSVVANVSDTSRIVAGQLISGPGIPSLAQVVGVTGTTVTISGLATATVITPARVTLQLADTIFTYSTSTVAQGSIAAGHPASFVVPSGTSTDRFVLATTDILRIDTKTSGSPVAAGGEVAILAEVPATSGYWTQSYQQFGQEFGYRYLNAGTSTKTFTLNLPFVIDGRGQPQKLVSRLNVDFNTIVTFTIIADGTAIVLDPVSGTVANTGGLINREFTIPFEPTVAWHLGATGLINVSINAQPGGSAAFAHISLSHDTSPFIVFV